MALIALTRNGSSFNLNEDNILYVKVDGSASKVTFISKEGGIRQELEFDEDQATIVAAADRLYILPLADFSDGLAISASRIANIDEDDSSQALVEYDDAGATTEIFVSSDDEATTVAAINLLL